jgi:hypothetical protein
MRPTLAEQLRGLHHILDGVIRPEVQGDYPREILLGVMRSLEILAHSADHVGPFLEWDNRAMRALLESIASLVPLTGPIEPDVPIAVGDIAALDAENDRLRTLLAAAIPALGDEGAADLHRAVVAHLRERIDRHPFGGVVTRALSSAVSLPTR